MHYKLLHPTNYIGAQDLDGKDHTITIETVIAKEELVMQGGIKEIKPVLTFVGRKKKLVLNKTNAKSIAGLHGEDTNAWIGKAITIYPSKTKCGKEVVDCVRIRSSNPTTN